MTECRNCDKPIPGGRYCSNLCEDMDRHPAPVENLYGFTTRGGSMNESESPSRIGQEGSAT